MERSRRVGVRSIYARNNEDGEQDKASNHEDSAGEKSPVVGGAPRTTSSPRTTRSGGRGETGTPSPSKRTSISDDTTTSKKRPADSNLSPPFKRGRGRPPASARAAAPPTLLTEGIPKEEHDGEEERYDAVVASPTRTRRGNAAAAPPVFHEQPILDAQDDGQEQMINHTIDEHMQDDLMHEDAPPPSLDLCGRSEGDESSSYMGGSRAGLLGGALARRGRPINSTSRKNFPQKGAQRGRDQEAESSAAMIEDQSMMEEELMEEDSMMESRSDRGGSRAPHNLYNQHRESHRYLFNPDILSDFYEPDMIVTEMGDKFLKAREGTLPSLLKREMILSLIVNDTDRAESNDWVNSHPPAIPPLTANVATYICFVDTKTIEDAKLLTTDGLSPWSSSHPIAHTNMTPTRPKVRKWAVYMRGGEYCISGEDWRMSLYVLVEYSALLPRAPRLRKRVYYMTRDRTLLGLAMLIYDYIEPGPIPNIVAHGMVGGAGTVVRGAARTPPTPGDAVCRSQIDDLTRNDNGAACDSHFGPLHGFLPPTPRLIQYSNQQPLQVVSSINRDGYPPLLGSTRMYARQRLEMVRFTDEEGNRSLLNIPVSQERPRLSMALLDPSELYDDDFSDVDNMDFVGGGMEEFDPQDGPFMGELVQSASRMPDNFVRVTKGNWTSDKTLLLKYLINETGSIPPFAVNSSKPAQPPLISSVGCFATFLKGSQVVNHATINADSLSPWTNANIRPKTRKIAMEQTESGEYIVSRKDWRTSNIVLMEMCTTLARCPRLRKRIYYVMRNNLTILGYILFMYEYTSEGDPPEIQANMKGAQFSRTPIGGRPRPAKYYSGGSGGKSMDDGMEDMNIDVMEVGDEVEVDLIEDEDTGAEELDMVEDDGMDEDDQREWYTYEGTDPNLEVFEGAVRSTVMGDRYIVCRTRRLIGDKNLVLRYCVNDLQFAYDRGIVLASKPFMPPVTSTVREEDPQELGGKQMRTKVKKYGLERDADPPMKDPNMHHDGLKDFRIVPGKDWHTSEVVLVMLHSTLPRCPRLQKKVFYVLDTREQSVLGHVMIVYEYTEPGEPPRQADRPRRTMRRREETEFEIENVEDDGEIDKDSPFDFAASAPSRDQCIYVPLMDPAFLMDRNRQLHYCVNRGYMLERNGLLNHTVPLFPPLIGEKGDFVYFVSGADMDPRNLTCDGMAPWSDSRLPQATRPKSRKLPVEKSRDGVLRYVGGTRWEQTAYFLVVYYAVLPRCPRLKKRIIYACNSSNEIIGNIMIIYSYTEEGAIPQQVPHGNATTVMQPFYRMPPSLRDEAKRLLLDKRPAGEVATVLNDRSPSVTSRAIYNISKSMRPPSHRRMHMYKDEFVHPEWYDDAGEDPTRAAARIMHPPRRDPNRSHGLLPRNPVDGDIAPGQGVHKPAPRFSAAADSLLRRKRAAGGGGTADDYDGYAYDESGEPYIDVVADASIEVGHSEEIASTPAPGRRGRGTKIHLLYDHDWSRGWNGTATRGSEETPTHYGIHSEPGMIRSTDKDMISK
ncbi:hypothetical protein PRIPAC_85227 [Pristionchus pacificus]|uniref:DUF7747 domain-containing protein n=1 Tax=Pristionchus pacificus TaxID=54126 RepID=A0A2A6BUN5_PRIPA|nr:hypothetical protein PRIPAC_85227 [Pristionchus pacificus]|eukprot:PDM69630.1 hypothetical protein PRIPAC_44726 [Pristionchus pacificus]